MPLGPVRSAEKSAFGSVGSRCESVPPSTSTGFLDSISVRLYRDHRASVRITRPSRATPAKKKSGRAVAYPDPKIVTVTAPTNEINPPRPATARSARSTTPERRYIVVLSGG
jgi:hypothetical protein